MPQWFVSLAMFTQAVPQRMVPSGQTHIPAAHVAPAGQAMLHPPQCDALTAVFTSHPLAVFASQLAKPVVQAPSPHMPPTQVAAPFAGVGQTIPQRPQCATVVLVFTSQPLAAFMSQLPKPALQVRPQALIAQVAVPFAGVGQAMLQAPQWRGSLRGSMHAPPQSRLGVLQSGLHTPARHD